MSNQGLPESAPTIDLRIAPQEIEALARAAARSKTQQETIGERLARMRRERGLTQADVAERLGIVQPVVSDYERGELRLHGQLIIELTRILGVTADELLGLGGSKRNGSVKNRRWLKRMQQLERLPKRDQEALVRTIDAFLDRAR